MVLPASSAIDLISGRAISTTTRPSVLPAASAAAVSDRLGSLLALASEADIRSATAAAAATCCWMVRALVAAGRGGATMAGAGSGTGAADRGSLVATLAAFDLVLA